MSAPSPVLQVFLKETREMLRDKRVRMSAFVMPVVVMFMMVSLFGAIASSIGDKAKQKVYFVETNDPLLGQLKASPKLELVSVPDEAAGIAFIKKGQARLVAEFLGQSATGQEQIKLLYDPKEDTSQIAKATFQGAFEKYLDQYEESKLHAYGLTKGQVRPLTFIDSPVKVGEGPGAGSFIVGFLPYLLVLFTFSGGINFAGDIVAGEKEKSTLETLLISPVPRTQIVMGKFLALAAVCLTSGVSSIVALILASVLKTPGAAMMFSGGLGLTPRTVVTLLALILPLVGFFAGALIAVSSYARNSREAQTYIGLLYMVVLVPAVFSQVLGFTDYGSSAWINFVPVLNTAANIRTTFQGKPSWTGIGETVALGIVLAACMLWVAVRLFNREQVLDRT